MNTDVFLDDSSSGLIRSDKKRPVVDGILLWVNSEVKGGHWFTEVWGSRWCDEVTTIVKAL